MNIEEDTLPQLPAGWLWTKLSQLAEVIRGASPRPKGDPRYFGGSIPWIMISDVTREKGKFISRTKDTVTKAGADRSRFLPKDTLILSNSGTVCVPKILAVDGCIHDGFVAFPELPSEIEMLFLFYYFDHIRARMIQENRQGVTQVNLNTGIVKDIDVPLPPRDEQQRIVAKIEELFTQLDAGVAELRKAQAQLKRYRQAVLKAAVTGELTKEWREAHQAELEPASELLARILKERRAKWETDQIAKMKAAGKSPKNDDWKKKYRGPATLDVNGLPGIPPSWIWGSVEQVGAVQLGRQRAPKHHSGLHMRPYLRVANVFENRIDVSDVLKMNFTPDEYKVYKLNYGDILLNEGQSLELVGRPAIFRDEIPGACFQNTLVRFSAYAGLNQQYALTVFRAYLHIGRFQRIARWTTNIAHLGAERFAGLEFPLPSEAEQIAIVTELDRVFSLIDAASASIDAELRQAERMRQSILKQAFEGKLVPQDPNDEPAAVLLERIKIERAKRETEKRTAAKSRSRRKRS